MVGYWETNFSVSISFICLCLQETSLIFSIFWFILANAYFYYHKYSYIYLITLPFNMLTPYYTYDNYFWNQSKLCKVSFTLQATHAFFWTSSSTNCNETLFKCKLMFSNFFHTDWLLYACPLTHPLMHRRMHARTKACTHTRVRAHARTHWDAYVHCGVSNFIQWQLQSLFCFLFFFVVCSRLYRTKLTLEYMCYRPSYMCNCRQWHLVLHSLSQAVRWKWSPCRILWSAMFHLACPETCSSRSLK